MNHVISKPDAIEKEYNRGLCEEIQIEKNILGVFHSRICDEIVLKFHR
jgi:hypothetical protein